MNKICDVIAVAMASFCESGVKWNAEPPVEVDVFGRCPCIIDEKSRIRLGLRSPSYHTEFQCDEYKGTRNVRLLTSFSRANNLVSYRSETTSH